jgi:hypothetical protein
MKQIDEEYINKLDKDAVYHIRISESYGICIFNIIFLDGPLKGRVFEVEYELE